MSGVTFEIFGAAFISAGILVFIIRRLLKINDIRLELIQKRLEATELRVMKLDKSIDDCKTHFDNRCNALYYQLEEIKRQISDVNIKFTVLETRADERLRLFNAQPVITAKRPYRRRNQEKEKEGTF